MKTPENFFAHSNIKDLQKIGSPKINELQSFPEFSTYYADGDLLSVRDLVPKNAEFTSDTLAQIRKIALAEPTLVGRLVSLERIVSLTLI